MRYCLGLDMGISSIGWAVVEIDQSGSPVKVENMGVRKFGSGREDKTQAPLSAKRRQKRSMRRQRARFLRRQSKLLNALIRMGLMPSDQGGRKQVADCIHPQILKIKNKEDNALTPYHLRALALREPLTPFALGRSLFALNQRRGFQSNRKEEKTVSKKFYEGIEGLQKAIEDHRKENGGVGALGSYFVERLNENQPVLDKRGDGEELMRENLQTLRQMYIDEFNAIREFQSNHQSLSQEDWDYLYDIIFYQRPLKEVERGNCQLYGREDKEAKRAYAADPLFQALRIWQDINNLKVLIPSQRQSRYLTDGERKLLWNLLQIKKSISFSSIRTHLKLPPDVVFNLSSAKSDGKLKGAVTNIDLSKKDCFGTQWEKFSVDEKSEVVELLAKSTDESKLVDRLITDWGATSDQAERLAAVSLEAGTSRFSQKALKDILELITKKCVDQDLNRYMSVTEAIAELGGAPDYISQKQIPSDRRLKYYAEQMPELGMHHKFRTNQDEREHGIIGNPSVHIALNQLRKVVNAIIDKYGMPTRISVELARDIKLNKKQKEEYEKRNNRNKKLRKEMLEECAREGVTVNEESREDFRKYKLWKELSSDPCSRKCVYTGKTISIGQLFSPSINVEHILPRSRTLDDSFSNLTLAFRDVNKMKGNETPYEYYQRIGNEEGYEALLDQVKVLPANKRWRFMPDAVERLRNEDGWLSSMLNDTRYMSKVAHKYLRYICTDVQVSPGRLTSKARGQWLGSTPGLEKDRANDHRHHAIDALVVALINKNVIQKAQNAAGKGEDNRNHVFERVSLPCPMDKEVLREQTASIMDTILVSHRVDHGVEGALHKETAQGHDKKSVVDFLATPEKATPLVEIRHWQNGKERINYYPHSSIHHIDFWLIEKKDKKGSKKQEVLEVPVYMFQARQTKSTRPKEFPTAKFIMRLHNGDTIIHDKDGKDEVVLVQKITPSKTNRNLTYHRVNRPASKETSKTLQFSSLLKFHVRKAHVDVLGRIKVGKSLAESLS